jgi:hypothetical protein
MAPKGFMDQELFEYAATVVARATLSQGWTPSHAAGLLKQQYDGQYLYDPSLDDHLAACAGGAIKALQDLGHTPTEGVEVLGLFMFYVEKFDRTGKKKGWKLLGGSMFNQAPANPQRVEQFSERFTKWLAQYKLGLLRPEWLPKR